MTSKAPSAEDIKEAYIKARLDAWLSRAVPMTMSESLTRQSALETQKYDSGSGIWPELLPVPVPALREANGNMTAPDVEDGIVISDSNPKGYLFVPLDLAYSDQQFLRQQLALGGEVSEATLLATEALLDAEIERGGYLIFDDSERPLSEMKTYEKVNLIAKYRLTAGSPGPGEKGEKDEKENEANVVVVGGRKMFHLHVTRDAKLAATKFVSALDDDHKTFLQRLETISAPLKPAAYLNYTSFETETETEGEGMWRQDLSTMTEAEALRWAEDFVAGLGDRLPDYGSWSYRFSDVAGAGGAARRVMDGDWRTIDRPEDLRAMFNAMRGNDLAPAFIRSCEIWEARYVALKNGNVIEKGEGI